MKPFFSYLYQSDLLGPLYLTASGDALTSLDTESHTLFAEAQPISQHPILTRTVIELEEYFSGRRTQFTIPTNPAGTPFQKRAWKVLCQIPYGKVLSYGEQAKLMGTPKGFRAVGGANSKNPIPIIIPCHRVVGSRGNISGFSNGIEMKIKLLKLEGLVLDEQKNLILRR